MTAAQRATLEGLYLAHAIKSSSDDRDAANALRAALGTCGNCQHAGERSDERQKVWCAAPLRTDADLDTYPHSHKVMPLSERCTGWTAKEGA